MAFVCPRDGCGREMARQEGLTRHLTGHDALTKVCRLCSRDLPRNAFRELVNPRGVLRSRCRECDGEWSRNHQREPAVRARGHALHTVRKFGMGPGEYQTLWLEQGGVCAICGEPETRVAKAGGATTRLAVDHDHVTGEVRGLLCHDCNIGVGMFNDDPAAMAKAIAYLNTRIEAKGQAG